MLKITHTKMFCFDLFCFVDKLLFHLAAIKCVKCVCLFVCLFVCLLLFCLETFCNLPDK